MLYEEKGNMTHNKPLVKEVDVFQSLIKQALRTIFQTTSQSLNTWNVPFYIIVGEVSGLDPSFG